MRAKIVAVDISYEEMVCNTDVDDRRVANVVQDLPFGNEEVDLLVSRTVLEHLEDLDGFLANARRVLKKDGYSIHLFPSKFAPFALINQALPNSLARRVLFFLFPERVNLAGFPAYYNNCYYSGAKKAFESKGFDIVRTSLSYYQSEYFSFFVPLFLVSALYEMLIQRFRARNLCAFVLIVAKKRPDASIAEDV